MLVKSLATYKGISPIVNFRLLMMTMIMMSKYIHPNNFLESIIFFLVVDKTITLLKNRFEHFEVFESIVEFLFDARTLKSLDNDELKKS